MQKATSKRYFHRAWMAITMFNNPWIDPLAKKASMQRVGGTVLLSFIEVLPLDNLQTFQIVLYEKGLPLSTLSRHHLYDKVKKHSKVGIQAPTTVSIGV